MSEYYEYDRESDLLDVWFGEKRAAWTVELTDNITISIDRRTGVPVALSFLDFTELVRATPFGPRSFPITGLGALPAAEREIVLRALTSPPVNTWLDVSSVERPPESPFAVAHLEPPPSQVLGLLAA